MVNAGGSDLHKIHKSCGQIAGQLTADTPKFNTTADGTATTVDVQAWGYQQ
jgi:hypothetical protein